MTGCPTMNDAEGSYAGGNPVEPEDARTPWNPRCPPEPTTIAPQPTMVVAPTIATITIVPLSRRRDAPWTAA
jgi:hypothetical protein